jgi:hypothetical protein
MLNQIGVIRGFSHAHLLTLTDCNISNIRSTLTPISMPRENGPTHTFPHTADDAKSDSGHSKKSAKSGLPDEVEPSDSSGDESTETASRKGGNRRGSSASRPSSRPPSRPSSRASRKRAYSAGAEKEKEKTDKAGKIISMADWASSAVSSVTGRGKKDKENFTTLMDDDGRDNAGLRRRSSSTSFAYKHSRSKSGENVANVSPKLPVRIIRPLSLQGKKLVRALYDFTGSADELTFKVGDEIVVLNEVVDGWWVGELDGRKGLFPTPYTEAILSSPFKQSLSMRSRLDQDEYATNELDDNHLYGESPVSPVSTGRSPLYGNFDAESITDSATEEEEEKRLMPARQQSEDDAYHARSPAISQPSNPPIIPRRSIPNLMTTLASSTKKTPPPPPPRRPAATPSAPPPIPQRKLGASQSRSSGSMQSSSPQSSSVSSLGHEVSPFESATEISMIGCRNFSQHPFKPTGTCSNCLRVHE